MANSADRIGRGADQAANAIGTIKGALEATASNLTEIKKLSDQQLHIMQEDAKQKAEDRAAAPAVSFIFIKWNKQVIWISGQSQTISVPEHGFSGDIEIVVRNTGTADWSGVAYRMTATALRDLKGALPISYNSYSDVYENVSTNTVELNYTNSVVVPQFSKTHSQTNFTVRAISLSRATLPVNIEFAFGGWKMLLSGITLQFR